MFDQAHLLLEFLDLLDSSCLFVSKDQVWEVDSMPELDKLAELEVSDLLTKAIVSNGGKQNAHTTEMVGSGNSSIMPSDVGSHYRNQHFNCKA